MSMTQQTPVLLTPAPAAAPAAQHGAFPSQGAPAPAPEQQPAPAAPAPAAPAPTPASNEIEADDDESNGTSGTTYKVGKPVQYDPTGDAALDIALDFFGKLGLGPKHAAIQALANGDTAVLKAQLALLGDAAKGHEKFVALAEESHKRAAAENEARRAKDAEAIHAAAGGKEQWEAIKTWAKTAATDTELADVNKALKAGGLQAKMAVEYLANRYTKSAGVSRDKVEPSVTRQAASNAAGSGNHALSPREYAAEVAKLRSTYRGDFEGSKEYANLKARRAAYRG